MTCSAVARVAPPILPAPVLDYATKPLLTLCSLLVDQVVNHARPAPLGCREGTGEEKRAQVGDRRAHRGGCIMSPPGTAGP